MSLTFLPSFRSGCPLRPFPISLCCLRASFARSNRFGATISSGAIPQLALKRLRKWEGLISVLPCCNEVAIPQAPARRQPVEAKGLTSPGPGIPDQAPFARVGSSTLPSTTRQTLERLTPGITAGWLFGLENTRDDSDPRHFPRWTPNCSI